MSKKEDAFGQAKINEDTELLINLRKTLEEIKQI